VPIHFRCPHCEKLLAIGTAKGGTQIHCPLCDRLITVPPRTEVNLPTATMMPPDLGQAWWMDAPIAAAPQSTPPSETPASPTPPQAWWLTPNTPSPPAEKALTTEPRPSVPPPLPQTIVPPPTTEPSPDLLVFEPPSKAPPSLEQALREYGPPSPSSSAPRFFSPLHIGLLIGAVVVSLLALTGLIVLLRS
jgi:phage FluMu protein Com